MIPLSFLSLFSSSLCVPASQDPCEIMPCHTSSPMCEPCACHASLHMGFNLFLSSAL